MSHKVGIWIDHRKAVVVLASSDLRHRQEPWNLTSELTPATQNGPRTRRQTAHKLGEVKKEYRRTQPAIP